MNRLWVMWWSIKWIDLIFLVCISCIWLFVASFHHIKLFFTIFHCVSFNNFGHVCFGSIIVVIIGFCPHFIFCAPVILIIFYLYWIYSNHIYLISLHFALFPSSSYQCSNYLYLILEQLFAVYNWFRFSRRFWNGRNERLGAGWTP